MQGQEIEQSPEQYEGGPTEQVRAEGQVVANAEATATPERMRLGWWAVVPVAAVLFVLVRQGLSARDNTMIVPELVGNFIGTLLVASVLGAVAFFAGRRSNKALNVVFCFLMMFQAGILSAKFDSAPTAEQQAAFDKLKQHNQARDQQSLEAYEKGEVSDTRAQLAAAEKLLKESSAAFGEQTRAMMEEMVVIGKEIAGVIGPYEDSLRAFGEQGGLEPGSFSSKQAIVQRLAIVDRMQKENDAIEAKFRTLLTTLKARLLSKGAGEREASASVQGFEPRAKLQLKLRANQRASITNYQAMLRLLHENWGAWEWDTASSTLMFAEDAPLEEWKGMVKTLMATSEEEDALVKEYLGMNNSTPRAAR